MEAQTIDGVHAFKSRTALVWGDSDTLHIWRVELTGDSRDAPIRWTALPTPPELKTFKDRSKEEGSPQVHVNVGPDGTLRVFWADNEREFGEAHFKFDLHQAESADEGRTWRSYQSTLPEPGGGAKSVAQCNFVDRGHGWMLLFGDAGVGIQPQMLVTTSDGGRTWKKAADSDQHGASFWPWSNGPESLIVRSATVASIMTTENTGNKLPLVAALTEDGGQTWRNTPISEPSGFTVSELAELKNDPMRPHHFCVDTLLSRYDPQLDSYRYSDARYCSGDDGQTWLSRTRVPLPTAVIGDSSIPVYADATLGFAEVWKDRGPKSVREYALFITRDGGKTWNPAPALIAGRYRVSEMIQVTADEQGGTTWLILKSTGDSPHSNLFVSSDRGITWRFVPAAAR